MNNDKLRELVLSVADQVSSVAEHGMWSPDPVWMTDPDWAKLPPDEQRRRHAQSMQELMTRAQETMRRYHQELEEHVARVVAEAGRRSIPLPPDFEHEWQHPTNALGLRRLASTLREFAYRIP